MAWTDITLPTDSYTDITQGAKIYMQDQNGDYMQDQDGELIELQGSIGSEWTDIS